MMNACTKACALGTASAGGRVCAACENGKFLDLDTKACVDECSKVADEHGICRDCGPEAPFWNALAKTCVRVCPSGLEDVDGVCPSCEGDEDMRVAGRTNTD